MDMTTFSSILKYLSRGKWMTEQDVRDLIEIRIKELTMEMERNIMSGSKREKYRFCIQELERLKEKL